MLAARPAGREPRTLPELVASYERVVIVEALSRAGGSRTRAAGLLGITRTHFYRRVWALRIDLGEISVALGRPRKTPVLGGGPRGG